VYRPILDFLSQAVLPIEALTQISRNPEMPEQIVSDWHRKRKSLATVN
jgi:hypothetical protein